MFDIYKVKKNYPIFNAQSVQQWEQRWFADGNSSFGLMQQACLFMANQIEQLILTSGKYDINSSILICCGSGNNGGDGYLTAYHLWKKGFNITIFAPSEPKTVDCQKAKNLADRLEIFYTKEINDSYNIFIDALFGNGLSRDLSIDYQYIIYELNNFDGLKIALDIPSGLNPSTGNAFPIAFRADYTLCLMGLKIGLFTAKGRYYAGKIINIPLIPDDNELQAMAWINTTTPQIPPRLAYAHKGDFGHVLIIGGHANMGGAVIMAGESAIACGAGKVTIMCHQNHHQAIISRSPNIMVKNIDDIFDDYFYEDFHQDLTKIDSIAFGMGLGRDEWSEKVYLKLMDILNKKNSLSNLVLDADALYFLTKYPQNLHALPKKVIATPHSAEAARLLNCTADDIEKDRVKAIYDLHYQYGGDWVLKGAGSLILEDEHLNEQYRLSVCAFGNVGMATAGMGDVLSGMLASLSIQNLTVSDIVNLHALAGDELAKFGEHGLQAHHMPSVLQKVMNNTAKNI